MDSHETAYEYALHEKCFVSHFETPFDTAYQLTSLQSTAFEHHSGCLAEEEVLYSYSLPSPTVNLEEPPDQNELSLKRLEQRCSQPHPLPLMLPAWNHSYQTLPLPTMFLGTGFNSELDLQEYQQQVGTKTDPDPIKAWLPVLRVDTEKDEGLNFPRRACKLAQLLWHELENEKTPSDVAQTYLKEIIQEAKDIAKNLDRRLMPTSIYLDENLCEIAALPALPEPKTNTESETKPFVSVIDLTSESDGLEVGRDNHDFPQDRSQIHANNAASSSSGRPSVATLEIDNVEGFQDSDKSGVKLSGQEHSTGDYEKSSSTPESQHSFLSEDSNLRALQKTNDRSDRTPVDAPIEEPEQQEKASINRRCLEPFKSKYFLPTPPTCNNQIATQLPCQAGPHNNFKGLLNHTKDIQAAPHREHLNEPLISVQHLENSCEEEKTTEALGKDHTSAGHTYGAINLLTQFMEMRGVKGRQPTVSDPKNEASLYLMETPEAKEIRQEPEQQTGMPSMAALDRQLIAIAPEALIPSATGCCLISLQLCHTMIQHLEDFWPASKLIDRDYNSHLRVSNGQHVVTGAITLASQSFEADISLTPTDGIVVTSLLQVKQKPLPGSKTLTSIRQRIMNLSQRYQTLIVFVSEANANGEYMAEMPSSDLFAYSDFVGFASSLPIDICVYLVPGADQTLARWIQPLMARYALHMDSLNESMSFCNTSWELFFRQSGLNVRASQVLSQALFQECGTSGLVIFLGMTPDQQRLKYGIQLGLEEAIANAGLIWNNNAE